MPVVSKNPSEGRARVNSSLARSEAQPFTLDVSQVKTVDLICSHTKPESSVARGKPFGHVTDQEIPKACHLRESPTNGLCRAPPQSETCRKVLSVSTASMPTPQNQHASQEAAWIIKVLT